MAVLIVEEDDQVRVLAESVLQAEGHQTLSASSHEQTMVILTGPEPIKLLFTDLSLQGDPEAGLALATKAIELRPDLKVLYTTGQSVTDGMMALFVKNSALLPKRTPSTSCEPHCESNSAFKAKHARPRVGDYTESKVVKFK